MLLAPDILIETQPAVEVSGLLLIYLIFGPLSGTSSKVFRSSVKTQHLGCGRCLTALVSVGNERFGRDDWMHAAESGT